MMKKIFLIVTSLFAFSIANYVYWEPAIPSPGGTIEILLHVNIADWLKDIDLTNVGIQMNGGAENQMLCANTNTYSVFSTESTVGLGGSVVKPKNNIYLCSK
mgnify:CR=1 FL=1